MHCKRTIAGVAIFWWMGAPGLLGQDYLKQLEETLLKRRNENTKVVPVEQKDPQPASQSAKEIDGSQPPIELAPPDPVPSVLNMDIPANSSSKNGSELLPEPKRSVPAGGTAKGTGQSSRNGAAKSDSGTRPTTVAPRASAGSKPPVTSKSRAVNAAKPASGGGYLGMTVEKVENSGIGVEVIEVATDSPAWKAGFRNGDHLIAVAGTAISSVEDLAIELGKYETGTPIRFLVERKGRNTTLTAVLQDRSIANRIQGNVPGTAIDLSRSGMQEAVSGQAYFGANLATMSEAYRKQFGIGAFRGVSVTEVVADSPADLAGLVPGDCIVAVNAMEVSNANALMDLIANAKPGDDLEVSYYRGAIQHSTVVKLSRRSLDLEATWEGGVITQEMLTPDYVAALQAELDRVSAQLLEANAKVKTLEQRVKQLEAQR